MAALLALDACATLHLKQLDALSLLDDVASCDVEFVSTKSVEAEMVGMSLSVSIDQWRSHRRWTVERATTTERRAFQNTIRRLRPKPGKKDIDLVIVAERLGAVLFTHDGPAAAAARIAEVDTVDVIDLCAFVEHRALHPWTFLEELLGQLHGFAWRPDDLMSSIRATAENRQGWEGLRERLDAWRDDGRVN